MDQSTLQATGDPSSGTPTLSPQTDVDSSVRALIVSEGCDGADLTSVLDGLGWQTTTTPDADAAVAVLGHTPVDVLVTGPLPKPEQLLTLSKQKQIATVMIGGESEPPAGASSLLVTCIPTYTSREELRGRLAMVAHYRSQLCGVERELNKMQQLSHRLNDHFREVDEEMKLAGRLQRDFLPDLTEPIHGVRFAAIFRPATWVSGDMFDVFRIGDHHTGVYLADAVGHGMSASLLTMFIKRAIIPDRMTSDGHEVSQPSDVLSALNDALAEQELPNCQFVTACYGVIDHQARTFTLARGGHPYPMRLGRGGDLEEIKVTGGLLGLFVGAEFPSVTVPLAPGDKMVLYTDGIEHAASSAVRDTTDAADAIREFIRPLTKMPIGAGMDRVASQLPATIDDSLPRDDLTILAFEMPY